MRLSARRCTDTLPGANPPLHLIDSASLHTQAPPRYLTQDQVRAFFAALRTPRDRALFALIYLYGLRVGEVGLLRRGDVDLERGRILIRRLKGGAWSERPLFSHAASLLRGHLASRPPDLTLPLFAGQRGPLRKRRIQALFTAARNRAGLPAQFTCHGLRHSIATHLLDASMALEFVQDHLGHQSIRSTSIYARITDRHRAAVFAQLERSPWIVQPVMQPPSSMLETQHDREDPPMVSGEEN